MKEIEELEKNGLLRVLRPIESCKIPFLTVNNQRLLNFSSNDYLGLSQHPTLVSAATEALQRYGAGATASRLVCGSLRIFHELENHLAESKGTEAALTFSNGYATAMGTIPAIVGKGDTIILDKLSHACLIDAARLSGATLRIFPHNDLNKLERLLSTVQGRVLIVTESVFSMDGDTAPLHEICKLKEQYGALLLVDEAHGIGVLGPHGQGLIEELNLQEQVNFQMGTLGKAVGAAGGYLATSRDWVDLFINTARSFIYSTAPPPAQAAAALAGLQMIRSREGDHLRERLMENCALFKSTTPIVPVILRENELVLKKAASLKEEGFQVPAIRFPTVPRGTARLRITLSAAHTQEQIEALQLAIRTN